jgi:hypothetical protein
MSETISEIRLQIEEVTTECGLRFTSAIYNLQSAIVANFR